MSTSNPANDHLPDDVSQWPYAPADLLNVAYDADARTVKRAYAKLLRLYRPDDAPEEFQKLLAAKDSMLDSLQRQSHFAPIDQPTEASRERLSFDASPPDLSPETTPDDLASRQQSTGDSHAIKLAAAWQSAVDGQDEAAYTQCVELARDYAAAAVRAYWLLRLNPQLDAERTPFDWLVDNATRLPSDLSRSLLTKHLLVFEKDARDPRLATLLDDPEFAEAICPIRWPALASVDQYRTIESECDRLTWLAPQHSSHWIRRAIGTLATQDHPRAIKIAERYSNELSNADVTTNEWQAQLDDRVIDFAEELKQLRMPARPDALHGTDWTSIRDLLAALPENTFRRVPALDKLLATWWTNPNDSLSKIDRQLQVAPNLMNALLVELAGRIDHDAFNDDRFDAAWEAAIAAIDVTKWYHAARKHILRQCRIYCVPSTEFPHWSLPSSPVAKAIAADTAMHLMTVGWTLFAAQINQPSPLSFDR